MSKLSEYSKFDHLQDDDDDDNADAGLCGIEHDHPDTMTATTIQQKQKVSPIATRRTSQLRHVPHPTKPHRFRAQQHYSSNSSNSTTTTTRIIYEWEQTLTEVILYIVSPIQQQQQQQSKQQILQNVETKRIVCHMTATHLQVGLQDTTTTTTKEKKDVNDTTSTSTTTYYIDEDFYHPIDTSESTWCIEQEEVENEADVDIDGNAVTTNHLTSRGRRKTTTTKDVITIYLQKVAKGTVWEAPLCGPYGSSAATGDDDDDDNNNERDIAILDPIALQNVRQTLLLQRWQEENPNMDFSNATFNNSSSTTPDPRTYMGGISYE
jgi:CS domain